MISDRQCADYCAACYWDTAQFDGIIDGSVDDDVWVGIKHLPDADVIAFRGSSTPEDWLRDFEADMQTDAVLGGVHRGFLAGLPLALKHYTAMMKSPNLVITGHSLGAGRALIFAALVCAAGWKPDKVTVFGSPRPGGRRLKQILQDIPIFSYHNRRDPVCEVPRALDVPPWDYQHPRDLIPVNVAPAPNDPWLFMHDHHVELYQKAMQEMEHASQ